MCVSEHLSLERPNRTDTARKRAPFLQVPSDYTRAGQITDDVLWKTLVKPIPDGAR